VLDSRANFAPPGDKDDEAENVGVSSSQSEETNVVRHSLHLEQTKIKEEG
jgi:hypothetical protein